MKKSILASISLAVFMLGTGYIIPGSDFGPGFAVGAVTGGLFGYGAGRSSRRPDTVVIKEYQEAPVRVTDSGLTRKLRQQIQDLKCDLDDRDDMIEELQRESKTTKKCLDDAYDKIDSLERELKKLRVAVKELQATKKKTVFIEQQ
jgi:peptidoglycan hydrolase CwlO-like protein